MKIVKSPLFVAAVFAAALACGFTITDGGIRWLWIDTPWVAGALALLAVVLGLILLVKRENRACS